MFPIIRLHMQSWWWREICFGQCFQRWCSTSKSISEFGRQAELFEVLKLAQKWSDGAYKFESRGFNLDVFLSKLRQILVLWIFAQIFSLCWYALVISRRLEGRYWQQKRKQVTLWLMRDGATEFPNWSDSTEPFPGNRRSIWKYSCSRHWQLQSCESMLVTMWWVSCSVEEGSLRMTQNPLGLGTEGQF